MNLVTAMFSAAFFLADEQTVRYWPVSHCLSFGRQDVQILLLQNFPDGTLWLFDAYVALAPWFRRHLCVEFLRAGEFPYLFRQRESIAQFSFVLLISLLTLFGVQLWKQIFCTCLMFLAAVIFGGIIGELQVWTLSLCPFQRPRFIRKMNRINISLSLGPWLGSLYICEHSHYI